MPRTCFVIGPIGSDGSAIRLAADDFMKYIVSPAIDSVKLDYDRPVRADTLSEPGRITSQIIKLLLEADLVVADLTGNNANVYYELSLRHAIGKPVIHMAEDGTPLSFDVRDNRTIFYTMHSRSAEEAREELAGQIRRVHEKNYKPTNPIIETIGLVKLEQSGEPIQQLVAELVKNVEMLREDVQLMRSQQQSRQSSGLLFAAPTTTIQPGTIFTSSAPSAGTSFTSRSLLSDSPIFALQKIARLPSEHRATSKNVTNPASAPQALPGRKARSRSKLGKADDQTKD